MQRRSFIVSAGSAMVLTACGGSSTDAPVVTPFASGKGPSSSKAPYLTPIAAAVQFGAILTTGDAIGTYRMVGIPDGLGAYDNGNGTFTLLMAHELGSTSGVARAHGAKGAYVAEWVIDKTTMEVKSGSDLMRSVYTSSDGTNWTVASAVAFNRFCSADLAPVSAFYNSASSKGSQARIFLNGEESASTTARAVAHVASGADKGKSYVLTWPTAGGAYPGTGVSWENLLAHPSAGDKTIVMANSDGGSNGVYMYAGTKSNTGNEIQKAGLVGGTLYRIAVGGVTAAETTAADAGLGIVNRASTFTCSVDLNVGTTFLRPEDGAWDTVNPNRYYFVTTNQMDAAKDGNANPDISAAQLGRTRLWRLTFTDLSRPELGGVIEMLLDGTETVTVNSRVHGPQMLDNLCVSADGSLILQEDSGNNAHNAKVWRYVPASGAAAASLTLLAQHDAALFGDYGTSTVGSLTKDEESSGVIDVTAMLARGDGKKYFLLVTQNHALDTSANAAELVEGGQLMLMSL